MITEGAADVVEEREDDVNPGEMKAETLTRSGMTGGAWAIACIRSGW